MRNSINITGNGQVFTYILEYTQTDTFTNIDDIVWNKDNDTVYILEGDTHYYRKVNEWYSVDRLDTNKNHLPDKAKLSKIRVYIPAHSVNTYIKNIKYAVTLNTWINGIRIDFGTFIFKHSDVLANDFGPIKNGNNEYHEYIEFDILEPFSLIYSDDWQDFRHNVCEEPLNINNTGSLLHASLYVVDNDDDKYIMKNDTIGGITAFNISNQNDLMNLNIKTTVDESLDTLGFKLSLHINKEYDWLLSYLYETYGLRSTHNDISFELVIKNKDAIIPGPVVGYSPIEEFGNMYQIIPWSTIKSVKKPTTEDIEELKNAGKPIIDRTGFYEFFKSWENFEEGWNVVCSLNIVKDDIEALTIVSNELPITQEMFKLFINDDNDNKIININDDTMITVKKYNIINKINNKIIQIERPNDSKSNIIQPVFFRVNEVEFLTLHPAVTENICINLDDYKSKVDKFILQIEDCRFEQIGANNYGILFKIPGNRLPESAVGGLYYILNEDSELVTTGKYTCVR